MLASNCQVPLTSVLLLFELTRDYLIIVPTLAAVGISFWVSSQVCGNLYIVHFGNMSNLGLLPGGRESLRIFQRSCCLG